MRLKSPLWFQMRVLLLWLHCRPSLHIFQYRMFFKYKPGQIPESLPIKTAVTVREIVHLFPSVCTHFWYFNFIKLCIPLCGNFLPAMVYTMPFKRMKPCRSAFALSSQIYVQLPFQLQVEALMLKERIFQAVDEKSKAVTSFSHLKHCSSRPSHTNCISNRFCLIVYKCRKWASCSLKWLKSLKIANKGVHANAFSLCHILVLDKLWAIFHFCWLEICIYSFSVTVGFYSKSPEIQKFQYKFF